MYVRVFYTRAFARTVRACAPWIIHTNVDWKRCIIALRLRVRSTLTHFTVVRGCIYGDSTGGQRKARRKAAVKLLKNNAKASFAST